jgi:hypothetical protein
LPQAASLIQLPLRPSPCSAPRCRPSVTAD